MARRTLLILLVAAAAVVAIFYVQKKRADEAEWRAGLDATRVLSSVFDRTSELKVAQLGGTMVTRTQADGCYGLCRSEQATRASATIDYFLDLQRLPITAYRWNADARVMFVDLPEVRVAAPNVDMAHAEVRQNGSWISRDMGRRMQSAAAVNLTHKAAAMAQEPANLLKAREAARSAMQRLIAAPLVAAGMSGVTVTVRFASDPVPNDRRWDVSRPIADVLADPRFKP